MSLSWIADAHTDFLSHVWRNDSILDYTSPKQGQVSLSGLHKGTIGVKSKVGEGTSFIVMLPLQQVMSQEATG